MDEELKGREGDPAPSCELSDEDLEHVIGGLTRVYVKSQLPEPAPPSSR